MSKYPDNPYWCQQHDRPYSIDTQDEWEAANLAGHITVEHVLDRLQAMLEYEFASGAEMGFDENGFLVSLVADRWRLAGGVSVHIYANDHPPPHVHARVRAEPRRHLRLAIATGELLDEDIPDGWAKRVRRISAFVVESRGMPMDRWVEMHGAPSTSSL